MQADHLNNFGWRSHEALQHHEYTIPAIMALLPDSKPLNIIDIGCGNGFLAHKLAEMGHNVVGIDIAEDGIKIASRSYPDIKFLVRSGYDNLDNLLNDSPNLIVSSEVIEHLYYPQKFLKNIHGSLAKGGHLILTTPYHGYMKNLAISIFDKWDKHHDSEEEGAHIKFFSERTMKSILTKNGFHDIEYKNSGRIPYLWRSMVCRAQKKS